MTPYTLVDECSSTVWRSKRQRKNPQNTQSLPTYLPSRDTITKRISTLKQKIKKNFMTAVMNGPFQPNK